MKRSGTKGKYSSAQVGEVTGVQFVAMSQQIIESWSVAEITQPRLYQGSKPAYGSPNDQRLGVSSQDQQCKTCGQTKQCQGHFGHIKLAEPVFHLGFIKYIQKILKCVCHQCYRVKICTNDTQKRKFNSIQKMDNPVKRLSELTKLLHNIRQCPLADPSQRDNHKKPKGCGSIIPTKIYLRNYRIYVEDLTDPSKKKREKIYERNQIKRILEELSKSKQCQDLGFTVTKPIDLMIHTLAIPPPQIRPSIEMNPQLKAEDDITSAYVRILHLNAEIQKSNIQHAEKASKVDELERTIAAIMIKLDRVKLEKSASSVSRKKTVKTFKSISDRLKGKQGRFRQNLMGKRVDFSARSVVSPDPSIALDQLGVPQKVAQKLTVPQEVTSWNYHRILNLCKQKKVQAILMPPEDKIKDDQRPINISKMSDEEIQKFLNFGMIAERCLQNGDYVLFNRQPTLHRMSMMGHRVKILPYNTFRLNLSVCTPYNADFDGDEMNMHVPQSFETISELKNIAHVPKQIVAPKNNAPIMGIVQDALLGVYLFTMRDTFLTRQEIMNLVIWIEGKDGANGVEDLLPGELPIPAILKPEPLWTGKQVMSLIIPRKITIQIKKSDNHYSNLHDTSMIIKKGELITGALQKQVVGSGAGGLVHSIWLQIGPDATNEFITLAQRVVNNWLTTTGFSVGAADIGPDAELQAIIAKNKHETQLLYYRILTNYRNPKTIEEKNLHQRGKKVLESFEFNINENLNSRLTKAQDQVKKNVSPYLNNIFKMITAKSKGSETNLSQILFLVGNQNVDGKRCPLGFSRRALPHFSKDDNSPEPRGFVFTSFYRGLKPHEFFFHAMGGRQGLSDTAVKTSRTGYIQRKLVKSLEDLVIKYDGTVRDSQNNFLQKLYGEDGFISQYIEKHRFSGAQQSEQDYNKNYKWKDNELIQKFNYSTGQIMKLGQQYQKLLYIRKRARQIFLYGKDQLSVEYYCPIKVDRLVNKIKAINYGYDKDLISPLEVYQQVERLLDKCIPPQCQRKHNDLIKGIQNKTIIGREIQKKITQFQKDSGIQLFRIHIRHNLASKRLNENFKLTRSAFQGLIEEVQKKFYQALAQPGESIGSIAAQSIGEPTTQMTLNTFHLAGVSDKNVTLGVPRLQQLLDSSKNIKTPNMTVFLKTPILYKDRKTQPNPTKILQLIHYHLPERHVKDYLQSARFYYDPDPLKSKVGFGTKDYTQASKRTAWVINFQFDFKKLTMKNLWEEIYEKIQRTFKYNFEVIQLREFVLDGIIDNNPQIIMRCLDNGEGFGGKGDKKDNIYNYLSKKQYQVKSISIGGIPGIKSVKTSKKFLMNLPIASKTDISGPQKEDYEYVIFETEGTNLKACLSHPMIAANKTYTNDMNEIYQVLGIEAARQCFINQFKQIIKPYGIYVNHRHLSVLTDWMSMRGFITPVNRNGINRVKDISILRKASYEETAEILFGAAVFSEKDQLRGISEKVIFGQAVDMGTNSFKIMIDQDKVEKYSLKEGMEKKDYGSNDAMVSPSYNPMGSILGDRTPNAMNTPNPYNFGDQSIRSMRGGMDSPAFTPGHQREMQFTPNHRMDMSMRSPTTTPLNLGNYQNTPMPHISMTPRQNAGSSMPSPMGAGSSYYHRFGSSGMRSPYPMMGSSSSSPNYSIRSSGGMSGPSPSYNNSPSPYNSSPNYSSQDSGRLPNLKEDEDHEDQEEPEF